MFRDARYGTVQPMGRAKAYRGASYQGNRPEWGLLLDAVGEEITGHFMWMFEVVLTNGTPLQAYKHNRHEVLRPPRARRCRVRVRAA